MKKLLKNLKNKKKLLNSISIGILIASLALVVTIYLGRWHGNMSIYYIILFLIGPPILAVLATNSGFVYCPILYIYFVFLSVILGLSNKKEKKLILGAILLLHLFSVGFLIYTIKSHFEFIDQIDLKMFK